MGSWCKSRTALLVTFICQIFRIVQTVKHGQNLIWAQKPVSSVAVARIVGIDGNPSEWVSTGNVEVRHISAPKTDWLFRGLTYLYKTQTLYWSESKYKRIQGIALNGSTATINVFTGTSSVVDGVTIDWLSNNIYWTDALYNWIVMMPLKNSKAYRFVVDSGLDSPHGIAIYPSKGYIFWTDWGKNPKIETSDLIGNNRREIVTTHLRHPQGLAVDFEANRLYWVDSKKDTIESVEFNGKGRKFVAIDRSTNFYGIALYSQYLFVTEQSKGHLRIFDKITGDNQINYQLGYVPYGITMYDETMQPGDSTACDEKGCEHICVNDPLLGPTCLCGTGFDINGTNCVDQQRFHRPSHIYTIKSAVCQYPANLADMSLQGITFATQCFLKDKRGYLALAYDAAENTLYYSENATKSIQRVKLQRGSGTETVTGGIGIVEGLALDWISNNLYWTDSKQKVIRVSKSNGYYQITVVYKDLQYPLGIAVHPQRGKLYWSDRGDNPKIEESDLNGEFRKVLDVGELKKPNHIYVDVVSDILYWADAEANHIGSYNLNTRVKTIVYTQADTEFFGVTAFRDYVLWTASGASNGIHAAIIATGVKVRGVVHPGVGQAADVITFDPQNQPPGSSPCSYDNGNGGCQQLCLQGKNESAWCYCGLGYLLEENNQLCSTESLRDHFLLLADGYMKQIYQIDVPDGYVNAINLAEQQRPIAIDYDPSEGKIFWTDNTARVIKTANIDGRYEQVIKVLPNDSVSDGIAVDYASKLVYYTDAGSDIIGIVSMNKRQLSKIIVSDDLDEPRAIVLDPQRGTMYWTDWGKEPKIETANMDGTDRNVLVKLQKNSWPNGLALDSKEKTLYWIDAKYNRIESIGTDGNHRKLLIEESFAHYYDLSLMGEFIYITDWNRKSVMRMHKKGISLEKFGPERFGRLNGIHGYNSSEILHPQNWCQFSSCRHFCIPISFSREVCACADGYGLAEDGVSCILTTTVATTPTTEQSNKTNTGATSSGRTSPTSQSTISTISSAITFVPSASPFTAIIGSSTPLDNITSTDVTIGPTTELKTDTSDSHPLAPGVIVAISILAIVVVIAAVVAAVYCYKRRGLYNPHSPLKEDRRGDNFYQITFSDTKDELQFDSGIENPSFDCIHENSSSVPPL